jgi:hypothetical protein
MKIILKFTLAVAMAGLLTACLMNGLKQSRSALGINGQTNNTLAAHETAQFLDQLTAQAIH